MDRITVTLPEEMVARIDDLAGDSGEYENRSAAVRALIRKGERLDEVAQERDRLREQLAARNARQDDVGELVEYVERERSLREQERERRRAPVWKRAKWWVLGEPEPADS